MKFVGTWALRPNMYKSATARFLENRGKPPEGIRTIGRWHYADGSGGVHIFECDNAQVISDFIHEWADVLEMEIRPAVEEAEAGVAMAKQACSGSVSPQPSVGWTVRLPYRNVL
jgi:Protein of unknown function (DUF3303)